jgi:hypothetical protein
MSVDTLVENLVEWGKLARKMPPSFEMGGVAYDMHSPDGQQMGKLLPGRGFLSAVDLKSLGITRNPPYVYDPSRYQRITDEVRTGYRRRGLLGKDDSEVIFTDKRGRQHHLISGGAITNYDVILAGRGAGQAEDRAFVKTTITTTANIWYSLFRAAGHPAAGTYLNTTAPTDANLDRTNAAALSLYFSNPTSPARKYLLTFGFTASVQINIAVLVDIINHGGGFRLSVATAETVTTPTITGQRQYGTGSGVGNLLTFICSTAGTPGAGTFIAQYVNQAGSNTNAPTLTTAAAAILADVLWPASVGVTAGGGSFFMPLASGDTGVQAVKQTTCSVAGTGTLASNVFFPLSFVPGMAGNAYIERDATSQIDGVSELVQATNVIGCLGLYVLPNSTTTGTLTGFFRSVAG